MATNHQNFMRKIKINIGNQEFNSDNLEIRFEIKFDDNSTPNVSKVEIYNLSPGTISKIKRADTVIVQAGYGKDIGIISSGKMTKSVTKWSGVDKITTVYFIEGDDFSRIKVSKKTATKTTIKKGKNGEIAEGALAIKFKKGTNGMTIIKRLTSALGMKLDGQIELVRNKVYKKGFTCTKIILNDLEDVVRDCGSILYYRRGKLCIRPLNKGNDEKFTIESDTGLMGSPTVVNEDGQESIQIRTALQFRITTCSIINVKSKTANGRYRVYKGVHFAGASDFYTDFNAI